MWNYDLLQTGRPRRQLDNELGCPVPIGVVQVVGTFGKGDVVALSDPDGIEFARGLSNYSSSDATKISGLRTEQIGEALGTVPYDEIIHRDNLVVII